MHYLLVVKPGDHQYLFEWIETLITKNNVEKMTEAGRCRWKIENECFNTLKNQSYNIEHNYGHGKQHLSYNMYLLTLLAFYFHQIFELTDSVFQACRTKFGSKRYLWEVFRGAIRWLVFDSWSLFMDNLLNPEDWEVNCVKNRKKNH